MNNVYLHTEFEQYVYLFQSIKPKKLTFKKKTFANVVVTTSKK